MVKVMAPFYEPVPHYMQHLLMMGARFVAGNTGEGDPGGGDKPGSGDPKPTPPKSKVDDPLGEPGLKALQAEREAREKAEKELKELKEQQSKQSGTPPKEAEPAGEKQASQPAAPDQSLAVARLEALLDHPVPKEYRHLVQGDTKEEIEASAKAISELATRPGVVRESGQQGNSTPGSISEYRAQIRERNKKK